MSYTETMSPMKYIHDRNLYYVIAQIYKDSISHSADGAEAFKPGYVFVYDIFQHRSIVSPTFSEHRKVFQYLSKNTLITITKCVNSNNNACPIIKATKIYYSIPILSAISELKKRLEKQIDKYAVDKQYLSNRVRISLAFEDGWIYVCFEAREFKLNKKSRLRTGSDLYDIFEETLPVYGGINIANSRSNEKVFREFKTSRNLRQVINKVGFKGLMRSHFFPMASENTLRFTNPVYVPLVDAEKIYLDLEKREIKEKT